MKREKLYIVLRELLVRKEAVYMNVEKEHVKKEDESITREIKMRGKRDHRAEDEWEEMNPHVRWDFIEEAVARERKIVKEPTPFERYQQNGRPITHQNDSTSGGTHPRMLMGNSLWSSTRAARGEAQGWRVQEPSTAGEGTSTQKATGRVDAWQRCHT